MEEFEFFLVTPLVCHSNATHMPCEWLNIKYKFECHPNGLREMLFWLNRSNPFKLVRTSFWPTVRTPFLSVWYQIAQRPTCLSIGFYLGVAAIMVLLRVCIKVFENTVAFKKHEAHWDEKANLEWNGELFIFFSFGVNWIILG